MAHTRGPWLASKRGAEWEDEDAVFTLEIGDVIEVKTVKGLEICRLICDDGPDGKPLRTSATMISDAMLISQAPTLLYALRAAVGELSRLKAHDGVLQLCNEVIDSLEEEYR